MSLLSGRNESTAFPEPIYTTLTKSSTTLCVDTLHGNAPKRTVKVGNPDTNLYAAKYSTAFTAPISGKIMIHQGTVVDKLCIVCIKKTAEVWGQISVKSLKYTTASTAPISAKFITA